MRFEACAAPDGEGAAPSGDSLTAMQYPVVRVYVAALAVQDGFAVDEAFAAGACVLAELPADLWEPEARRTRTHKSGSPR